MWFGGPIERVGGEQKALNDNNGEKRGIVGRKREGIMNLMTP